jgi:hypothetical protein
MRYRILPSGWGTQAILETLIQNRALRTKLSVSENRVSRVVLAESSVLKTRSSRTCSRSALSRLVPVANRTLSSGMAMRLESSKIDSVPTIALTDRIASSIVSTRGNRLLTWLLWRAALK